MYPLLVVAMLMAGLGAPGAVPAEPHIVEVYPNPATTGDDGEFVSVWVPPEASLKRYDLVDSEGAVPIPGEPTAGSRPGIVDRLTPGRVVTLSTNATRTAALTDRQVRAVPDGVQLANTGDRVGLVANGSTVDTLRYEHAPEAEVYSRAKGSWAPLKATDRRVITQHGGTVEAFVLPDESDRAVSFLAGAERRILLAGYTLSSSAVVEELVAAKGRNVTVEVLVEGSPVGGLSGRSAVALDELEQAGVTVRVAGGDRARYRYHHAKYAIVDDRALVTTENWKPSGIGGQSSRGWSVITPQEEIVAGLAETFQADIGWEDTIAWSAYDVTSLVDQERARGDYPSRFEAKRLEVDRTRLLLAPDNAEGEILEVIESAQEEIAVKQVRIGDRTLPFFRALLAAARDGVRVRILLSGEWYVREDNRRLARWVERRANSQNLPIEVRLATPAGRYEKIHAKGMIVDEQTVLLGSLNWNKNSIRQNREVALLLDSTRVAAYYGEVFAADWSGSPDRTGLPAGLALVVVAVALLAVGRAMYIQFDR